MRLRVALTGQEIASTEVTSPRGPFRAEQCGATIGKSSIMYPNSRGAAWYCKISDDDRSPSNSREIRLEIAGWLPQRGGVLRVVERYIQDNEKEKETKISQIEYVVFRWSRGWILGKIIYSICSETLVPPARDSCWYKYVNN